MGKSAASAKTLLLFFFYFKPSGSLLSICLLFRIIQVDSTWQWTKIHTHTFIQSRISTLNAAYMGTSSIHTHWMCIERRTRGKRRNKSYMGHQAILYKSIFTCVSACEHTWSIVKYKQTSLYLCKTRTLIHSAVRLRLLQATVFRNHAELLVWLLIAWTMAAFYIVPLALH